MNATAQDHVEAREAAVSGTGVWPRLGLAARTGVVVGLLGALAVGLVWRAELFVVAGAPLALVVLVVAAAVDGLERRLPNRLVAGAAAPVAGAALTAWLVGDGAGVAAVTGALLVAGPLLATHLVTPVGLGFGDVKAGAVLGGAAGLAAPTISAAGLMLGLAAAAGWGVARRRPSVPLGPALVGATILALLGAPAVGVEPW